MSTPNQLQGFLPEDSFFNDLVTMLASIISYMFTMHVATASNNPTEYKNRSLEEWIGYISPLKSLNFTISLEEASTSRQIHFYPFDMMASLTLGSWPKVIQYRYGPLNSKPGPVFASGNSNKIFLSSIVGACFTSYYESQKDHIEAKFSRNHTKWPPALNLARYVRNGFAHNGKYAISDPKAPAATWGIWTIDASSHGKEVMFAPSALEIGDIILLMQEIDKSLK